MKGVSILLVLMFTACASTNNNDIQPGDADRAVAGSNENFSAASRAGKVDRLMDFYSDSAEVMPPNHPAVSGRDAIRQFWASRMDAFAVDIRLISDDITQSCDMAAERGQYELTLTPKAGGATIHDSGKYVVVRRKLNGQWKAVTDMFSSNLPVPNP